MSGAANLRIVPLTRDTAKDFFAFFEGEAFTDNPSWAACYCHFVLFDHARGGWKLDRPELNKAQSAALIATRKTAACMSARR